MNRRSNKDNRRVIPQHAATSEFVSRLCSHLDRINERHKERGEDPFVSTESLAALKDLDAEFKGTNNALKEGLFQWPPEIVEWVRAKTGFEPEKNDPLQPKITDFQYAFYRLLREETGHSFEEFEDMTNSDFIRVARVMARIEKRKTQGDSVPDTTKTETKKRDKKPESKKGRKPYPVEVHNRDKAIYDALKSGATYEGLMERYGMKKTDVRLSRDRHRKKVEKKRERLE